MVPLFFFCICQQFIRIFPFLFLTQPKPAVTHPSVPKWSGWRSQIVLPPRWRWLSCLLSEHDGGRRQPLKFTVLLFSATPEYSPTKQSDAAWPGFPPQLMGFPEVAASSPNWSGRCNSFSDKFSEKQKQKQKVKRSPKIQIGELATQTHLLLYLAAQFYFPQLIWITGFFGMMGKPLYCGELKERGKKSSYQ